ncbi:MAG: YgiQ family radical SAM protein [candidate division Zixibacteria bacterium]|nr:YgiQ family radical SAM protein [candidate division Zixibacteria bacterium]
MKFLPTTKDELKQLGWDQLDIILISGDSYIDSPFIGIAVIGRYLTDHGFKVGIIAQPDTDSEKDICRLGEPKLFWGVSGGSVDSMVANYTASKKRRKSDDFTPGGINNRRPDRAVIVYSNLIRKYFKGTRPIVLGGIEASLRRVAHYDYWSNKLRKSILFDAKADALVYGMAEKPILNLALAFQQGDEWKSIKSICYISNDLPGKFVELPSFEEVQESKAKFTEMFHLFYKNNDPLTAKGLYQKMDTRYLIQNPPEHYLSQKELDSIYESDFTLGQHPYYEKQGAVKALDTIRFSLATHRGCYGECNFCAIAVHQGQTVRWRSEKSILNEAEKFQDHSKFKGIISDAGGPTANMYGFECDKKIRKGCCEKKRCLYPKLCPQMEPDHSQQISLLKKLSALEDVKKVFVASGLRYDLIINDKQFGKKYLQQLVNEHTSGQMKVAPEHTEDSVLKMMGKPGSGNLQKFNRMFSEAVEKSGSKQFLTYYLIAAHPGCTEKNMKDLKEYTSQNLRINPEQVQIFTPLPSTYSALMYYTEQDPFTGKRVFVEKDINRKQNQKAVLTDKPSGRPKKTHQAKTRQPKTRQSKTRRSRR